MTLPASATARRSRGCGASAEPRVVASAGAWVALSRCSIQCSSARASRLAPAPPVKFFYAARRPWAGARRFLAGSVVELARALKRR